MNTANNTENDKRHETTGRSPMLTVIFKNRQRVSFAYAYLLEASYTESTEGDRIQLNFGFSQVILEGVRLEIIYRNISLHHADEVVVVDKADVSPTRGSIHSIEILRAQPS